MALTNVLQTVVTTFMEGVTAPSEAWRGGFDVMTDDVAIKKLASFSGIGAVPVWDGVSDLDVADLNDRFNQTLNYTEYGLQLRIPKRKAKDVPGLLEGGVRKLGVAVANTYGSIAAERMADIFDTTTSCGDGVALCDNTHTSASGAARDNRLATLADRSGFFGAINLAMLWTSYHGQEDAWADDPLIMFGSPADSTLVETWGEVFGSAVSSDQMQKNIASGYDVQTVVWPKLTVSTRQMMFSRTRLPLVYWIRDDAEQGLAFDDEDNLNIKVNVDFAIATGCKPDPAGCIGFITA